MKVLVIGSGAREHALAWKLSSSPHVDSIITAPGNGGTAALGVNLPASLSDMAALAALAHEQRVDLTVVGPETPLEAGITDVFNKQGLPIFGPSSAAARIESSKAFAKDLMQKHDIPHPEYKVFTNYADARSYIANHNAPVVVKTDGLSAGKGVVICQDQDSAQEAIYNCMEAKTFGEAGEKVVLEEYLTGREVSVFAFCDGVSLSPLVAACDYKRVYDNDVGPNTGGMGSYAIPEFWNHALEQAIKDTIMAPTIKALSELGSPYKGVLYAGLMITSEGPLVLEYNCRLGDPETQVILPLLETDLTEAITASVEGNLNGAQIRWSGDSCVGVVLASGGYPGPYSTGEEIDGLDDFDEDVTVFHAGTKLEDRFSSSTLVTDGGRVMTVVALGADVDEARKKVYRNVGRVRFPGVHYRSDIGISGKAAIV